MTALSSLGVLGAASNTSTGNKAVIMTIVMFHDFSGYIFLQNWIFQGWWHDVHQLKKMGEKEAVLPGDSFF